MYCSKCGNEVLDEAVLCPKCGCLLPGKSLPKTKVKNVAGESSNKTSNMIINIVAIVLLVSTIPFLVFSSLDGGLIMIFAIISFVFSLLSLLLCFLSIFFKNNSLEVFKHFVLIIAITFSFLAFIFDICWSGWIYLALVGLIIAGILAFVEVITVFAHIIKWFRS